MKETTACITCFSQGPRCYRFQRDSAADVAKSVRKKAHRIAILSVVVFYVLLLLYDLLYVVEKRSQGGSAVWCGALLQGLLKMKLSSGKLQF